MKPSLLQILFFLFILFVPSQLGKHYWPSWSFVNGVRIDYLSPTLYLSDILVLIFVAVFLFTSQPMRSRLGSSRCPQWGLLGAGILYLLVDVIQSPSPTLSFYWTLRYAEIPLVGWAVSAVLSRQYQTRKSLRVALSITTVGLVALSIAQIFIGGSTGFFWWIGERRFVLTTPGIATISLFGKDLLRPYATFPHPNALGGWFGVLTLLFLKRKWKSYVMSGFAGIGMLVTFSRGALLGITLSIATRSQSGFAALVQFAAESTSERIILLRAAFSMIRDHWLIGVGPGQFLPTLPRYLPAGQWLIQPVHNVFLLALAEFGWIGMIIMGLLIASCWKGRGLRRWIPVGIFLLTTGLVDHYWLTSQQNRLLLGILVGIVWSDKRPIVSAPR